MVLNLSTHTHIMGIINCTPDSFYAASRLNSIDKAVETGIQMVADGADILDIGGESTRPGSDPVPVEEELARVIPVVEKLVEHVRTPISVDTTKAAVARQALLAGAHMINDVSALQFDADIASVISEFQAGVVLMHIQGTPKIMQKKPHYTDVIGDITTYFRQRIAFATERGIQRSRIVLDPGLGFGKSIDDNYRIIKQLDCFRKLGFPILLGPSRKSFIQKVLHLPAAECLEGTAAAVAAGILNGAAIVRVHDVKAMARVAKVIDHLKRTVVAK